MDSEIRERLKTGGVIPAHPLALGPGNRIDENRQRALSRYYLACGVVGLAVGVHTTQFAVHDPRIGLYKPVLQIAREAADQFTESENRPAPVQIAGITGPTAQAVAEAETAKAAGYHLGLLALTAMKGRSIDEIMDHVKEVARVIPVMGFYLQESIANMKLPAELWQRMVELPELWAVKIAPFNRYQTLDVLEAVAHSGRAHEIALYTGNDDAIIQDLLATHVFHLNGEKVKLHFAGGLLGQWAVWTKRATEIMAQIREVREQGKPVPAELLTLAGQLTLANREIFDAENRFAGCVPGIAYVLKKQGLVEEVRMLDPQEKLSSGQAEKIHRIMAAYPHLTDDEFVKKHLSHWLSP